MKVQTYVKRLQMERRLWDRIANPVLPEGFALQAWDDSLRTIHAEVKWHSFRHTLDAVVFPKLGWHGGCQQLMDAIATHAGFAPEATWLIRDAHGACGCIQGVAFDGIGMIQNLGVLPAVRGRGLGRLLVVQAMLGFKQIGLHTASLEVSARNTKAVRLYHDLGFHTRKTLYRETHEPLADYTI